MSYPLHKPEPNSTYTIHGIVIYSTAKAHKLMSRKRCYCWVPKAAVYAVYKSDKQLTLHSWFKPVWLD